MLGHFNMSDKSTPRPYEQWSTNAADHKEDAAYTFGYYLMKHCRAEALKCASSQRRCVMTRKQLHKQVESAVDTALHNVLDLIEGYWPAEAGQKHTAEFALLVRVSEMRVARK
jgi:hypothetical protein